MIFVILLETLGILKIPFFLKLSNCLKIIEFKNI